MANYQYNTPPVPPLRTCAYAPCGAELIPHIRDDQNQRPEPPYQFAKRKFCGASCAGFARSSSKVASLQGRACESCGMVLERKERRDGRLERPCDFAGRRFCDVRCAGNLRTPRCARCYRTLTGNQKTFCSEECHGVYRARQALAASPVPPPLQDAAPAACPHCRAGPAHLVLERDAYAESWSCRRCGWDWFGGSHLARPTGGAS